MARIRTFIAIEVPDEIKKRLGKIQDVLRSECDRSKGKASFVRAANIHLTLKFLGDIEETATYEISRGLRAAASEIKKPFDLTACKVEIKSGRVLWIPVEGGETLTGLVRAINDELEVLGYERDKRRFRGHLTLARIKTTGTAKKLEEILTKRDFTINATFTAKGLTLFKSELTPEGAIYTALRELKNFPSTEETG